MDVLLRLAIVVAVLGGAALVGWWWNRRQGEIKQAAGGFDTAQLEALGIRPDTADALGVLLGSPTCGPCESVKRVLAELESDRADFRWTYADAADHLDIAREHHVLRVPTLFILADDGRILARTSGVPAKHDLERVIERRQAGRDGARTIDA